jgi:hypothetical protein
MLTLGTAARLVYAGATGKHANDDKTLDKVARLIASRTRIYTRQDGEIIGLLPDEVLAGSFEEGGASLRFPDPKRPPIRELAIDAIELGRLIDEIRQVYAQGG